MDEDVSNVYSAMELKKGSTTMWRWIVWISMLDFLTYLMMKICLGKYVALLCNDVDGIGSL